MNHREFFDLVDMWSLEKRRYSSLEVLVETGRAEQKVLSDSAAKIELLEMGIHAECERVEQMLKESHETDLHFNSNDKKV